MNRTDLTAKQTEALEKIAAAGEAGFAHDKAGRKVINIHTVLALRAKGLVHGYGTLRLTDAGRALAAC